MVAVDVLKASSLGFTMFVEYDSGQPSSYNLTKTYSLEGEEPHAVTLVVSRTGELLKVRLFRLERRGDELVGMTEVSRLPASIEETYRRDATQMGY